MQAGSFRLSVLAAAFTAILCAWGSASAQPMMPGGGGQSSGMPDARMMSGIPMPMPDVGDGTVSVRVVRGEISNVLPGQQVELIVDGNPRTASTDDSGRAQFTRLTAGMNLKASVTVGGERIESQPFTMPGKGGIRLLLAAGASGSGEPAKPAVAGTVTFGGETRVVVQFDDDTLSVFYLLEVVNNGPSPINPQTPLAFDLPSDAANATVMQGSSPQVTIKGRHVSFGGPFNPGRTSAQLAYNLTAEGGDRTIEQPFPAALDMVSVAVEQVGELQVKSPQLAQQQAVPADGRTYLVGNGPTLPANRPLTLELNGLPHHPTWPRNVALALAVIVLAAGLWGALGRSRDGASARRQELEGRRERLFGDLLRLEQEKRSGRLDAEVFARRRGEVLSALERIYGELDSASPGASSGAARVGD